MQKIVTVVHWFNLLAALFLTATMMFEFVDVPWGLLPQFLFFSSYIVEFFLDKKWKRVTLNKTHLYFLVMFGFFGLALVYYPFDSTTYFRVLLERRYALWNAIRHSDIFGAAGSMSGGVDIRPFPDNWEMKKQLGELAANEAVWDSHTVINQVDKLKNGDLALIVDCGESDFFLDVNRNLHKRLLECKIDHDFITRPGGHTGTYWNNSIDYHILFFCKFFSR
jgi:hypothetical protein